MLDRRAFTLGTIGAGALAAVPAAARATQAAAQPERSPALAALFDALFQEGLELRPETATQLGLDKGANAGLRGRLSDLSDAGRAAAKAQTQSQLARLQAIDPATLSPAERIDHDVVLYTRRATEEVERFDFGGSGYGPSPYVVSQITGAYQSVPDFLDTKHRIETREDADA